MQPEDTEELLEPGRSLGQCNESFKMQAGDLLSLAVAFKKMISQFVTR